MSFDQHNGRGRENLAQSMAQDLDCGNSQGVARILKDIYKNDRSDFNNIVRDINRNERNGRGDDLTITQNGEVYISDRDHGRTRQIRVGRIEQDCDPRDQGRGGRRDDNCDPRDRGRDPRDRGRDWDRGGGRGGRGGVDIDIDINNGRGRGRGGVDIDVDIDINNGRYPWWSYAWRSLSRQKYSYPRIASRM